MLKKSIISTLLIITSSFLRLLLFSLVTRLLGNNDYGQFVLILSIIMILSGVSQFGMPNAVLRWGGIYASENDQLSIFIFLKRSVIYAVIFSVVILVLSIGIYHLLISFNFIPKENTPTLIYIATIVVFIVLSSVLASFFRVIESTSNYFYIKEIIPSIIQVIGILLLFLTTASIERIMIIFLFSYVASVLYAIFLLKKIYYQINNKVLHLSCLFSGELNKELVRFGFAGAGLGFLWVVKDRVIVFIVAAIATPEEVGVIFNAGKLSILMTIVVSGINVIFSPKVSAFYHHNKTTELESLYKMIVRWVVILVFPIVVFISFNSQNLMAVIFSQGSFMAGQVLFWFVIFKYIGLLAGSPGVILQMIGMPRYEIFSTSIVIVLSSISVYLALTYFGIIYAVIALGGSALLVDIYRSWFVYAKIGILSIRIRDLVVITLFISILFFLKYGGIFDDKYSQSLSSIILVLLFMITMLEKNDMVYVSNLIKG